MTRSVVDDLGAYIRDQRHQAQISVRQLARLAGVSNPYLSQIERGLRRPSAEILARIASGLRISAEALYIQAGLLDEQPSDTDVISALRADRALTERQKAAVIDIYTAFLRENTADGAADRTATRSSGSARPTSRRAPARPPSEEKQ